MKDHHGNRYYAWTLRDGRFHYFESPHLEKEKRLEAKYVVETSEKIGPVEAVATYKQLMEVESGFRNLKDVLGLRPIHHQVEPRVRAHIFVAALALLVQRLSEKRLQQAGSDMSAKEALQSVQTIRRVTVTVDGEEHVGASSPSPRTWKVLNALGIASPRPPAPPDAQPTAM